ncbi:MAG: hypothetical protein LBH64_00945, partial [Coriobacteriales bacterium]|nr:hypothetical protein [Coriobacteriales bacterium]
EKAGTLVDEGAYSNVANLSTVAELSQEASRVSVPVEEGDFYYEGVLDATELPWLIGIEYKLDDRPVLPEQLAGASGKLSLAITTKQNPEVDPIFFENYLLQVQVTLDAGTTRDLLAPDATIANAGADKQVAFMVLPGREATLTLEARVTDFEMPGIQLSALPFSMAFDLPDTDEMVADMETLADAVGQLDEGVGKLNNGVADLKTGSASLALGSNDLGGALTRMSDNSQGLRDASSQIGDALERIAKELKEGGVDTSQIDQLVEGLQKLAAGLHSTDPKQPGLAEGLGQIQGGITEATTAMDGLVEELVPITDPLVLQALGLELNALTPGSQATVAGLLDVNTKAAYVRGAWYGPNGDDGIKVGLDAAAAGIGQSADTCKQLSEQVGLIAKGLDEGLDDLAGLELLAESIGKLSDNYGAFNKGLVSYTGGLDSIASEYATFNSALGQMAGGIGALSGGVSDLRAGTSELYANVETMPETVQEEINSFLDDYQASDFTPRSFVSAANEATTRVQFVLRTDPIEVKAPASSDEDAAPSESFWDRLLSLFR